MVDIGRLSGAGVGQLQELDTPTAFYPSTDLPGSCPIPSQDAACKANQNTLTLLTALPVFLLSPGKEGSDSSEYSS